MLKKIKVLVVDDALLMRKVVSDILEADSRFEVVGSAHNGKMALQMVKALNPDVLTLDVEMPVMDGIQCLRQLMAENPTPTVMVSSITYEGGFKTLQALEAGAFDYIQKPKAQSSSSLLNVAKEICEKVVEAARSNYLNKNKKILDAMQSRQSMDDKSFPSKLSKVPSFHNHVIAVGISTGGPPCVSKLLDSLPESALPVLVVQHMPEHFTKAMAERINKTSRVEVKEAEEGDRIKKGCAFIAPGHSHMTITRERGYPQIRLHKKDPVSGHRPSVDVLFESVAAEYGSKAIGVIMTGMGRDGVTQLKAMQEKGAFTMAQDKDTSVVYGMPKAAADEGAVDEILPLDQLIGRIVQISSVDVKKTATKVA